jgi:hypothetical protein
MTQRIMSIQWLMNMLCPLLAISCTSGTPMSTLPVTTVPEDVDAFAQATLKSLGSGIMIIVGPGGVGYATAGDYPAEFDELFTSASRDATDPTEFLMKLVDGLTRSR